MGEITIVFCIPGRNFSNRFVSCLVKTLYYCWNESINIIFANWPTGCNIYKIRNRCLEGDPSLGPNQKPFQGKYKYKYLMWIDSDQVWEISDFKFLLETMEDKHDINILSGAYPRVNDSEETKEESPSTIIMDDRLLTNNELNKMLKIEKVSGSGLGFCIMRYGVMESLKYPWFTPLPIIDSKTKEVLDFTGDDTSLFIKLKEKGFDVWCATDIKIGHEKPKVFRLGE